MKRHSITLQHRGFGLIEVLITLLVFSFGVLAVAGLQALSKKNNFDALQRTTAASLAESIVASMRVNATARDSYLVALDTPLGSTAQGAAPADCYANECTPAQMAAFDLYVWEKALNGASEVLIQSDGTPVETGGLASPSACIIKPSAADTNIYQIVIAWRGVTKLGTAQTHPCGAGRNLYESEDAADTASYQRFFVLQAFIAQ